LSRLSLVIAIAGVVATSWAEPAQSQERPQTYTDSQAVRGQQWFAAMCQQCHPTQDMGSPDFKVRWGGLTALDLYTIISTTMPQEEPGSLSRRAYADIVAYLMQLNGLPPGPTPLTPDSTALTAARLSFGHASPPTR
jgi:S-disulfanyl-L-cysteine oxidoreductase SoxD